MAEDEKESGIRALLNFGHSFGHALESESGYEGFLHGEAVAIGMVTAARLSESRGLCSEGAAERLSSLLQRFSLPVTVPDGFAIAGLCRAMELDKKAVASGLRLILLRSIGQAVVDNQSSPDEITAALENSRSRIPAGQQE